MPSSGFGLLLCVLATPAAAPDGYHTPFTSKAQLHDWWATQSQTFQPETRGEDVDQRSGCCPDEPLSPEARAAVVRLIETLKYLYAHNVIKKEFPDLSPGNMKGIRKEVIELLARQGRYVLPTLLHELTVEARYPEIRDKRAHATAYATRQVMHYAMDAQARVRELEKQLASARTEGEAEEIREKIRHVHVSLQREQLDEIRNRIVGEMMANGLRPGQNYELSLEAAVAGMGVEAFCCLFEKIESSDEAVRATIGRILRTITKAYMEKGSSSENLLKAELPKILSLLQSKHDDLGNLGAELLTTMTGRDFGKNEEIWRSWLAEHYAPQMKGMLVGSDGASN